MPAPKLTVTALNTSAGDEVRLPDVGVTCIVGGNNVGKTQVLRDLVNLLSTREAQPIVLSTISAYRNNIDVADATLWLSENCAVERNLVGLQPKYQPASGAGMTAEEFSAHWNTSALALGQAANYVVWFAQAGQLVGEAAASVTYGIVDPIGATPMMRLLRDGSLERELSTLSMQTFGTALTVDRIGAHGSVLLCFGETDVPRPAFNDATLEYTKALEKLPLLANQGEGIKSFLGLAMKVLAGSERILVIDEPEAFLHPGQARVLGRWLGRVAVKRDRQVILATHDRDIVIGLLDSDPTAQINMVRVERTDDGGRLRDLDSEHVRRLWSDPVLRYSNVLQGLFHSRVVICEADADCRFYSAVLDHHQGRRRRSDVDDTLFVPSGGKARIATMAKALTRIGVDTRAIVDFDALKDRRELRLMLESLGGSWTSDIEANYKTFVDYMNGSGSWSMAKNQGLTALGRGEPFSACQALLAELALEHLVVVECGEMEDLDRTVGSKGATWVTAVLDKRGHEQDGIASKLVSLLLPVMPLPDDGIGHTWPE